MTSPYVTMTSFLKKTIFFYNFLLSFVQQPKYSQSLLLLTLDHLKIELQFLYCSKTEDLQKCELVNEKRAGLFGIF